MGTMAVITVAGEPGCRAEEVARLTAQRLHFDLVSEARLGHLIEEEFRSPNDIPDRAWRPMTASILARLATEHHLVVCARGAEAAVDGLPGALRVLVVAPPARRIGFLMLENRLERPAASRLLKQQEREERLERRRRFGRAITASHDFDLVINTESLESECIAGLVEHTAAARGLSEHGLLPAAAEAELQFRLRLQLARYGILPAGRASLKRAEFGHPSEQIFANLLDFYRIPWEYEPRSFPVQWDADGRVLESFTPDFFLPEMDLYVELTTMKQANVTRKNRKVKLLRAIYPHVNIQVFYQKDVQNLIFKYGLAERPVEV